MRYLLRAASFALLPLAAACSNRLEQPAVHPAARVPVRDFPEIAFLEGRWLSEEGGQRSFLLFEPDGHGGLNICQGGTAIGYAQPTHWFHVERGRMMVRDLDVWNPHLPGSWPLLRIGANHVLIDGSPEIELRRVGDRLEMTQLLPLPGYERHPRPAPRIYRLIRGPDAEVELPNCRHPRP